jgi:hypothetical protein
VRGLFEWLNRRDPLTQSCLSKLRAALSRKETFAQRGRLRLSRSG